MNGIPCDFIPDMGAEVTIILGNLVPECQMINEWEIIQGVAGKPVRAQCATVNLSLEGRSFTQRVVVANRDLLTDCVLFAIPLTPTDAKRLLLGAVSETETSGAENVIPDTQGGDATVVAPPSLPVTDTTRGRSGQQHCMVVTRSQAKLEQEKRKREEREALAKANLSDNELDFSDIIGVNREKGIHS